MIQPTNFDDTPYPNFEILEDKVIQEDKSIIARKGFLKDNDVTSPEKSKKYSVKRLVPAQWDKGF